eukprot:6473615-Amphidinium_carterae.1
MTEEQHSFVLRRSRDMQEATGASAVQADLPEHKRRRLQEHDQEYLENCKWPAMTSSRGAPQKEHEGGEKEHLATSEQEEQQRLKALEKEKGDQEEQQRLKALEKENGGQEVQQRLEALEKEKGEQEEQQ